MSSCCGNELIFNSVISEVVSANIRQIGNLANTENSCFIFITIVIVLSVLLVFLSLRNRVNLSFTKLTLRLSNRK